MDNMDNMENLKKAKKPRAIKIRDRAFDGLIPVTIVAAILGMLAGQFPAVIGVLIFGRVFYALYIAVPLAIYAFIRMLKGGRDGRAVIITAAFSLLGAYFTALSCEAAAFVISYRMLIFNIPLVAMSYLGRADALPVSASAYLFPLVFTALGTASAGFLLPENPPAPQWMARKRDTPTDEGRGGGIGS